MKQAPIGRAGGRASLRLAIIGDPIGHSISPAMYNAAFPALGIDATYEAWRTGREEVAAAVEKLRGPDMLGMNVTVPHKESVLALLDEVEAGAKAIGAVNCISKDGGRLIGHNTDKAGFIESLRSAGFDPEGSRVLVLGVGGSARAVCVGLLEAGIAGLTIAGRRPEAAESLAVHLRGFRPNVRIDQVGMQGEHFDEAVNGANLLVNCTPIGMQGTGSEAESPLPAGLLRPEHWVYDLVYSPPRTCLLRDAEAAGAKALGGLEMLVLQAAESVRIWTGREPPLDIMRRAAHGALGL